jgi:hypothetical protein
MGKLSVLLLLFLLVSFPITISSQQNGGAKQISLSNSDVALSNDVFSIFNNPAGLAQMNWREAGVFYSPAPFGFTELANGFIAYNEPFSFGSVGIGAMTYGFDLYKETKFIASFAYNYKSKFLGGIALNAHNLSIQNYGTDIALYINAGGLAYLTEELRIGFSIWNLNRATFGIEEDQIPVIFNSGVSYDIFSDLRITGAIEKDIRYAASLLFGFDYDIIKYFSLRTGFSTEPSKFSAGIGINYSIFSFDYALFNHNDLGLTHQAGIIISFSESSELSRSERIKEYLTSLKSFP